MSDRLTRVAIFLAVLLITIAATGRLAVPLHAQSGPVISLDPANLTLAAGEEQTVQIKVTGSHDLGGFQFDLLFPPGSVSLSQATLGPLLSSTGRSALPLGPANESGRISFGGFTFGEAAGAGGDGVLAVLVLRGETPGRGELRLDRVQLLDIQGNDLKPTSGAAGTVEVTGSAPAPTVTPGPPTPTIAIAEAKSTAAPGAAQPAAAATAGTPGWLVPALATGGALLIALGVWQASKGRHNRPPPADTE